MDLILYMFNKVPSSHWGGPTTSSLEMPSSPRKRFQKSPPAHLQSKITHACVEIPSVPQAQICVTIYPSDDEITPEIEPKNDNSPSHVGYLLQDPPSYFDTKESWSSDGYETAEEELKTMRRKMKTPVFAIGQLERASMIRQDSPQNEFDQAQCFAEVYKAVLPLRTITPCPESKSPVPRKTPKRLRKIKCQLSLRDLSNDQANGITSPRPRSDSDLETLVGCDSPCSPTFAKKDRLPVVPFGRSHDRHSLALSDMDNDIGLKMCMDLLTNELASVLFRHHPAETQNRASGLQILLMIESYETVQQHVRQQLYDAHVTDQRIEQLEAVEGILEHWLQVLYSVYDRSMGMKSHESMRLRGADWPLQRLEEENVPPYD